MNRFNGLLDSHFKGCRLLGEYVLCYSAARGRVYEVPDHPELVGYFDGTHSWIGPARGGDVVKALLKPDTPIRQRATLAEEVASKERPNRRVLVDSAPPVTNRRRVLEA